MVGEIGVLTGKIRSATVVSSEKSIALSLNTAEFDRLLRKYHYISLKMLRNVINDLSVKTRISNSRFFM